MEYRSGRIGFQSFAMRGLGRASFEDDSTNRTQRNCAARRRAGHALPERTGQRLLSPRTSDTESLLRYRRSSSSLVRIRLASPTTLSVRILPWSLEYSGYRLAADDISEATPAEGTGAAMNFRGEEYGTPQVFITPQVSLDTRPIESIPYT